MFGLRWHILRVAGVKGVERSVGVVGRRYKHDKSFMRNSNANRVFGLLEPTPYLSLSLHL